MSDTVPHAPARAAGGLLRHREGLLGGERWGDQRAVSWIYSFRF